MSWINKLNRTYTVEVPQSKENIIGVLKDRIEEAKRKKSWFSFNAIDYKKMQIDDYRMLVRRNTATFNPFMAMGYALVHFNDTKTGRMQIVAEIKPQKIGIWITLGCLVPISAMILWVVPGATKYFFLVFVWIAFVINVFMTVFFFNHGMKTYLKSILEDIGISNDLKKVNQ